MVERILRQTKEKVLEGLNWPREKTIETAIKRHEMIAPFLMPDLDEAEKRRVICILEG